MHLSLLYKAKHLELINPLINSMPTLKCRLIMSSGGPKRRKRQQGEQTWFFSYEKDD